MKPLRRYLMKLLHPLIMAEVKTQLQEMERDVQKNLERYDTVHFDYLHKAVEAIENGVGKHLKAQDEQVSIRLDKLDQAFETHMQKTTTELQRNLNVQLSEIRRSAQQMLGLDEEDEKKELTN